MMSAQKPSLWRVLSDTSRIITSNSLHFTALSLLFIFPISLFNVIHTLILQPSPTTSHYRRLLDTTSQGQIPSFDKSQLLYALALFLFNTFSVSTVTHSTFHAFHTNPIKLSSSLRSILSSFLPLLATKLAYLVIFAVISFGLGISVAFVFIGTVILGMEIDPASKNFMAVFIVAAIAAVALMAYLGVKWCLMDAVVVVESKCGFAPFERSGALVKGMGRVAFFMISLMAVLQLIMSGWLSVLAGGGCVALQMFAYAALSTAVTLFGLAATTVLFIHCKALNGESEGLDKLGEVYVPLSLDDKV